MSEFDWIARYFAPLAKSRGAAGLTDDVATLSGHAQIVTMDAIVESVHFLPDDPIDTVARKLVRVNVSDILAKGGYPDEALLTLGWPNTQPETRDEDALARFAAAFGEELEKWGISLIGGDTVGAPGGLFCALTLTGRAAGARAPVRRSGAQAGDLIWVTGEIGAGYQGLQEALVGGSSGAVARYRVPHIPGLEIADLIAEHATASMDVSDGLIGDLQKLLAASDCGAHLRLDAVDVFSVDDQLDLSLEEVLLKCTGGDDYQCLFTAPEAASKAIKAAWPDISTIGRIEAARGLRLSWYDEMVRLPEHSAFSH